MPKGLDLRPTTEDGSTIPSINRIESRVNLGDPGRRGNLQSFTIGKLGTNQDIKGQSAAAVNATKGNDVLSPGKGNGGYGDRMLLGPEGAISLNNKDTVIAGTDLFPTQRGNDVVSTGAGKVQMGSDNKETNALLRTLVTQNKKKPSLSPVGLYEIQ